MFYWKIKKWKRFLQLGYGLYMVTVTPFVPNLCQLIFAAILLVKTPRNVGRCDSA